MVDWQIDANRPRRVPRSSLTWVARTTHLLKLSPQGLACKRWQACSSFAAYPSTFSTTASRSCIMRCNVLGKASASCCTALAHSLLTLLFHPRLFISSKRLQSTSCRFLSAPLCTRPVCSNRPIHPCPAAYFEEHAAFYVFQTLCTRVGNGTKNIGCLLQTRSDLQDRTDPFPSSTAQ